MDKNDKITGIALGVLIVAIIAVCAYGITACRLWPWQL